MALESRVYMVFSLVDVASAALPLPLNHGYIRRVAPK